MKTVTGERCNTHTKIINNMELPHSALECCCKRTTLNKQFHSSGLAVEYPWVHLVMFERNAAC